MNTEEFSYPQSSSELNSALLKLKFPELGFKKNEVPPFRIFNISEFIWTDKVFFDICNKIYESCDDNWVIIVNEPDNSYFKETYGVLPVVFSVDANDNESYYRLIHRVIGKNIADSLSYLWENCSVFSSKGLWSFEFNRFEEFGLLKIYSDFPLPPEVLAYVD